jgi:16S rRNA (cytidine1402-2'-O)-methyltransferase
LAEVIAHFKEHEPKGEIVMILAGCDSKDSKESKDNKKNNKEKK